MSLFPSEKFLIELDRHRIAITPIQGWFRPRQDPTVVLEVPDCSDESSAQTAIEHLGAWLAETKRRGGSARIVLSDRLVRFAIVPRSEALLSRDETLVLARACFEPAYGDMSGWTIMLDAAADGEARLACAVETGLIDRLHRLFSAHRISCASLKPRFVVSWNRFYKNPGSTEGLFAVADAGILVAASFQKNARGSQWTGIRSMRTATDIASIESLLIREAMLHGLGEQTPIFLDMPEVAEGNFSATGRLQVLEPDPSARSAMPHKEAA